MRPTPSRSILALTLFVSLAGCSSPGDAPLPGETARTDTWSNFVEEPPAPPEPLVGPRSVPTPSIARVPNREFTPAERNLMDGAWAAFKAGDPAWEEGRVAWHALGVEARGVLAENLYRAMVAARAGGAIHLVQVARKELVLLGEESVSVLIPALATRAVVSPDGQEIRVGQEVLRDTAEALSVIGAASVPGLLDIAGSGVNVLVREAVWALGNIGDPRAETLLVALTADPDWAVRAEACRALRSLGGATAEAALLRCLEDAEGYVVQRAAESLAKRKSETCLPAVLALLDSSHRAGKTLQARASHWVLVRITGQDLPLDPEAWRRHLRTR
jgi:hypothetical protein